MKPKTPADVSVPSNKNPNINPPTSSVEYSEITI